jgi:hypothetical protein
MQFNLLPNLRLQLQLKQNQNTSLIQLHGLCRNSKMAMIVRLTLPSKFTCTFLECSYCFSNFIVTRSNRLLDIIELDSKLRGNTYRGGV